MSTLFRFQVTVRFIPGAGGRGERDIEVAIAEETCCKMEDECFHLQCKEIESTGVFELVFLSEAEIGGGDREPEAHVGICRAIEQEWRDYGAVVGGKVLSVETKWQDLSCTWGATFRADHFNKTLELPKDYPGDAEENEECLMDQARFGDQE